MYTQNNKAKNKKDKLTYVHKCLKNASILKFHTSTIMYFKLLLWSCKLDVHLTNVTQQRLLIFQNIVWKKKHLHDVFELAFPVYLVFSKPSAHYFKDLSVGKETILIINKQSLAFCVLNEYWNHRENRWSWVSMLWPKALELLLLF